jgi:hypothetical protein
MKILPEHLTGRWRITWMKEWARDAVDMLGPGHIIVKPDGSGEMHFIAVDAWLDCQPALRDGEAAVEFSWEGTDDGDARSGRGWLRPQDDRVADGYFCFHMGDRSSFRAERDHTHRAPEGSARKSGRRRRTGSA